MSYIHLLSDNMQKMIYDMGWEKLRPIQEEGIKAIINTNKHVILSANTAAGKTEAAFLPILSLIEDLEGCTVLYVAPLKTLLNNQYDRITSLTRQTNITVMKWHGDVSNHLKQEFRKEPKNILQITPEAFENMLMNYPSTLSKLFKNLQFIVVDEYHYFLESDRGYQLRSQIHRLSKYLAHHPRIICLSATININDGALSWIDNNHDNIEVVKVDNSYRNLYISYCDFSVHQNKAQNYVNIYKQQFIKNKDFYKDKSISIEEMLVDSLNIKSDFGLMYLQEKFKDDLFSLSQSMKSIIFINNKAFLEKTTFDFNNRLKDLNQDNARKYLIHHGSLNKEIREFAEYEMMNKQNANILATSTLELGVDIGDVDIVVQIGDAINVSSLKQRLGRAGRKGQDAYFQQYTTNIFDSERQLKILAMLELIKTPFIEEVYLNPKPYHLLFHQTLSMLKEHGELNIKDYMFKIKENPMLQYFSTEDIKSFLTNLIEKEIIELLNGSLYLYVKGEAIVNHFDFLTLFKTEQQVEVINVSSNKKIGMIVDTTPEGFKANDTIILAGKSWKVVSYDMQKSILLVKYTKKGKNADFESGSFEAVIHHEVAAQMLHLLNQYREDKEAFKKKYNYTNDILFDFLDDELYNFPYIPEKDKVKIQEDDNKYIIHSFLGEKMLNVFCHQLKKYNVTFIHDYNKQKITILKEETKNISDIFNQIFDDELSFTSLTNELLAIEDVEKLPIKEKYVLFLTKQEKTYLYAFSLYSLFEWYEYKHYLQNAWENKEYLFNE